MFFNCWQYFRHIRTMRWWIWKWTGIPGRNPQYHRSFYNRRKDLTKNKMVQRFNYSCQYLTIIIFFSNVTFKGEVKSNIPAGTQVQESWRWINSDSVLTNVPAQSDSKHTGTFIFWKVPTTFKLKQHTCTVELQLLEHWWLIYHDCFELVF